jgi:zinc D-Ala-D-Ala carboxypeptidase
MKYFKIEEFDFEDQTVNFKHWKSVKAKDVMKPEFLRMIDKAREISGIPYIITSGYRPNEYDKQYHKIEFSDHSQGCGADIKCNDSVSRFKIIKGLIEAGFTRIGFDLKHVHVGGNNEYKPQQVFFLE